ncbi:MAG TPA: cyclodeaminase/cyclohydrolase family protein, partial [Actinomycetota bacterium]|nr:cyclodeaminase/cyclohydrolase family protein [Actinomycetota bacterium]
GAALLSMVGRLTVDKAGFEDVRDRMRELTERADAERVAFLDLADRDADAFREVMGAFRLPKATDDERTARILRIQEAYEGAAVVPLELARRAVDLMELAEDATAIGNPNAASDGYSGGALLHAAALGAIANVRINAAGLKDDAKAQGLVEECDRLLERAATLLGQLEEAFLLRLVP